MNKMHFLFFNRTEFKKSLVLFLLFFIADKTFSQDQTPIVFGKVSLNDFDLPKSAVIDNSTSAVIIADAGNTSFIGNKEGWISYVFKKNTRIKIIDKKAIDLATIRIWLYKSDKVEEVIDNIQASTFNLENGKIVETKLDKKDVFEEKRDKNYSQKKFTLPSVKDGSIIEYSYTITSNYDFKIPTWEFQNIEYPCLWSRYEITIPLLLNYAFLRQGVHPFFVDKASEGHVSYNIRRKLEGALASNDETLFLSVNTYKHVWAMKDIPAFKVENYISTPHNYTDKIEFQLSQTYDGESTHDVKNSWANATHDLLEEDYFGASLNGYNHDFQNEASNIVGNETSAIEKAKKIYYYIRDNFTCTSYNDKYIKTTLRDFYKMKSGSVGEINLLLANMLREAGMHADPVLLSTTDFGFNSSKYPILDRLNYVICRSTINGKIYYLDASRQMLGFGKLADDCYNGHARIICNVDSGSVYFNADSIKETRLTSVFIINDEKEKNKMQGSVQSSFGDYGSYDLRAKAKRIGEKELLKEIKESYAENMQINNVTIDSLKNYEESIVIHLDFSMKDNAEPDIIYFNPIMIDEYKKNPFQAAERKYPIEMSYPIDEIYTLSIEIPAGYVVDELPKSAKVAYNENEGFFEYLIQKTDNDVQMRYHIKLLKAFFPADDYNSLRDFFGYIVKKESEQIVFKKKK